SGGAAQTLPLRLSASPSFFAAAGGGVSAQRGSDLAVGQAHTRFQNHRRFSQGQREAAAGGVPPVHAVMPQAGIVWRRITGDVREETRRGELARTQLQRQQIEGTHRRRRRAAGAVFEATGPRRRRGAGPTGAGPSSVGRKDRGAAREERLARRTVG